MTSQKTNLKYLTTKTEIFATISFLGSIGVDLTEEQGKQLEQHPSNIAKSAIDDFNRQIGYIRTELKDQL